MKNQSRIRDYGIMIGSIPPGEKNAIIDVKGVAVGHVTLSQGEIQTGVTAVLPHKGNTFQQKFFAATHVINGFGKTMGTIQIDELGTLETPIILTNTLSIGIASDALIEYMLQRNEDIGLTTGTVNPVVCECNDGYLNDIRGSHVKKEHIIQAIENAEIEFEEGGVGAGTGMSCYQLKGGIGSASRILEFEGDKYTVGVLVLSNMGKKKDLMIQGRPAGQRICEIEKDSEVEKDKGSIIMIVATDIPLTERQLKRISKRAIVGLSRTGSYMGNGSGEIVIAFSTANKVEHYGKKKVLTINMLHDQEIDCVFQAVAESTEEAVLNSLITANTTVGRDGNIRYSLKEYIEKAMKIE